MTQHTHDDDWTWHPHVETALRTRPILREAMSRDGQLSHHLREVSLFLQALDLAYREEWVDSDDLAAGVARRVIPSDRDVLDATRAHAEAVRLLESAQLTPHDVLVSLGIDRRCPECAAGKHVNCTGLALDGDDLGPCLCAEADHAAVRL
jgi:hypothetical protein